MTAKDHDGYVCLIQTLQIGRQIMIMSEEFLDAFRQEGLKSRSILFPA